VRHKIRHDTRPSDTEDEDEDDDTDTLSEEQDIKFAHHRWKRIWRQQDPPKKWVKETAKGHRTTVKDYANILHILRAL
jgi:hypothetical protein